MRILFVTVCLLFGKKDIIAQELPPVSENSQHEIEHAVLVQEAELPEDEGLFQWKEELFRNPVDLNRADASRLAELGLSEILISHLLDYRSFAGELIDVHELQAVPGWNADIIKNIKPFVRARRSLMYEAGISEHRRELGGDLMLRSSLNSNDVFASADYFGSPLRLMTRFRYRFSRKISFGLLGEKDAGETFFRGKMASGFDFYAANLFLKDIGILKRLVLGDFNVGMGQGLICGQGGAAFRGPDVTSVKGGRGIIRPYLSPGEFFFKRGMAISVSKGFFDLTLFYSYRKLDGNISVDSVNEIRMMTSFQTSGYHRNVAEEERRSVQRQRLSGGSIVFKKGSFEAGLSAMNTHFDLPVSKRPLAYNLFSFSGNQITNAGIHYSYTWKNFHFFGEAARVLNQRGLALINGVMFSASSVAEASFLLRDYSRDYQAPMAGAFSRLSALGNEKGFYGALQLRPSHRLNIQMSLDQYVFPWLRYRVNGPAFGSQSFVQMIFRPAKGRELTLQWRREKGFQNEPAHINGIAASEPFSLTRLRFQANARVSEAWEVRLRTEVCLRKTEAAGIARGFLFFGDLFFRPRLSPVSANIRLMYFNTADYSSRIYAYENDLPGTFSIPAFYQNGVSYYINFRLKIRRSFTAVLRYSRKITFPTLSTLMEASEKLAFPPENEIKAQFLLTF